MKYRIVNKEAFKVAGILESVRNDPRGVFAPNMDQTTYEEMKKHLEKVAWMSVDKVLYVTAQHSDEDDLVDNYIGYETTLESPDSLVELKIPKQIWAVFELPSITSQVLHHTWYALFTEWFRTLGYELVENAHFFQVLEGGNRYELRIPVIKR